MAASGGETRKANSSDPLQPICDGAFVANVVMSHVDVVRALYMSSTGTGAGAALKEAVSK